MQTKIPKGTMEYTTFLLRKLNLDSLPACRIYTHKYDPLYTPGRKEQILLTYSALLVIEDFINISCLFSICPVYGSVETFKQRFNTNNFFLLINLLLLNEDECILKAMAKVYNEDATILEDNANIISHLNRLCKTKHNSKNMILVFSELAISVFNYHAVPSTIRNRNSSLIGNYDYILYLLRKERIMVSCIKLGPQLSLKKQITSYEIGKYPSNKKMDLYYEKIQQGIQDVIYNDNTKILVDTKISTDIKINHNKLDIFVLDKKNKEILIVEVGINT
ncbi:hypothetical protein NAPIS_ORF00531 [Vairimorpha apis BRL 01]|uniref:Uncharacterized protein n=1 Tax=Vairimorpha apis BRL 01 TaxID=1037528 RepID=T0MFP1_9MICR|nr:hypothetical protein NAPIS_ORF00531 [Vairimorpha apis BRL 01]